MTLLTLASASELDRVAPSYQFHEAPRREVAWLRRLGRRGPEGILSAPQRQPLLEVATRTSFVTLAARPGHALATMNFVVTPRADGSCEVSTETRVYATDEAARRRFAAYWRMINLGSAFIHVMWLGAIKRRAEGERA